MAHIASCLTDTDQDDTTSGLNNYIAAVLSPKESNESVCNHFNYPELVFPSFTAGPSSPVTALKLGRASPSGEKPFVWRMQHPDRKYQLFPKDRQAVTAPVKPLDPAQAYALAMGPNGDKSEKTTAVTGLRIRIKEHHNLIRRRKISVPELGPMTTVQEAAMDSPTIPGRPPVHERSISAPGNSWKPYSLADCMSSAGPQAIKGRPELRSASRSNEELPRPQDEVRQPLSPKNLAPLVIPTSNLAAPRLARQISVGRLRSGTTPVDAPARPPRPEDSPRTKTPFTPVSAALTTPRSAATTVATASTVPTPVSAPVEHRASPHPWDKPVEPATTGTFDDFASVVSITPQAEIDDPMQRAPLGHRRHQSESGSIMERGRPRKRSDVCVATSLKRTGSKRSKSTERRAFEQLPKGWKATDAATMLSPSEVASLQKQALQQAARFEVLRKEDVDSLSRELRLLDERTEYLRRTYTTLRAGRRNLHTRICQYLRSPRTAKFSHESILKQEEVLAEFDTSIDDWVTKLEQAENRRTRVRQKLLEHVAAAATLGAATGSVMGVSESLQLALGVVRPPNAAELSTPPRSPVKPSFTPVQSSSSSPHRAHVPSTILEQPLFEEAASNEVAFNEVASKEAASNEIKESEKKESEKKAAVRRAETIRIYADNDVYALLADVENTITQMGSGDALAKGPPESLSDAERKKLCRTRSHDVLNGSVTRKPLPISRLAEKPSSASLSAVATPPPAAPAPPAGDFFLTSAVFKP